MAKRRHKSLHGATVWRKYGYTWVTVGFFLLALAGHWILAWLAFVDEQQQHGAPVLIADYLFQVGRDTLENWQSEFLQLIWQVAGLAFLLHVSSPQSHENEDRVEAKVDALIEALVPDRADAIITRLDREYARSESSH